MVHWSKIIQLQFRLGWELNNAKLKLTKKNSFSSILISVRFNNFG